MKINALFIVIIYCNYCIMKFHQNSNWPDWISKTNIRTMHGVTENQVPSTFHKSAHNFNSNFSHKLHSV